MNFELIYIFKCVRFRPNTFDYLYSAYYHVYLSLESLNFDLKCFTKMNLVTPSILTPNVLYTEKFICVKIIIIYMLNNHLYT